MLDEMQCNADGLENLFYVVIPILKPYPVEGVEENLQENILSEIGSLEGSYFVNDMEIKYKAMKNVDDYNHLTQELSPKRMDFNKMFVFRMTVSNLSHLLKMCNSSFAKHNILFTIYSDLPIFAYTLAYALAVYSDGIFDVDDFLTCHNNRLNKHKGLLNSFPYLHENDESLYRPSSEISLQKTLNWFFSIDDVIYACGKTALGKSLSVYSRMFSLFSGEEELFLSGLFSVIALEALYESNGSKKTLCEKVSSFLNIDKKECERDIKKIYDHRCSVAHGGFDLPFKFNANDGSNDFEKSFNKTLDSFEIGLRYLFKSYRKMIMQNKKELKFAYECL